MAFSFWITVELNMQQGLEGNTVGGAMKNVLRVFAVLTVPLTASVPKALVCYWITSNWFSLVSGLILRKPSVKKLLKIPMIPPPPQPVTESKLALSFFKGWKKFAAAQAMHQRQAETNPTITNQSSSPLQMMLTSQKVKGRNKKKKRKKNQKR